MEKDELLKLKKETFENLQKILTYQSIILDYYGVDVSKEQKEELSNKMSILQEEISTLEKEIRYEHLKNSISSHDQSFLDFSEKSERTLIELLKRIKNGDNEKNSKTNSVVIDGKIITLNSSTGWETIRIVILFDNLEDIKSYRLASYYYEYDYTSDPPFKSKPAEVVGKLGTSLSYLLQACEKVIK